MTGPVRLDGKSYGGPTSLSRSWFRGGAPARQTVAAHLRRDYGDVFAVLGPADRLRRASGAAVALYGLYRILR